MYIYIYISSNIRAIDLAVSYVSQKWPENVAGNPFGRKQQWLPVDLH